MISTRKVAARCHTNGTVVRMTDHGAPEWETMLPLGLGAARASDGGAGPRVAVLSPVTGGFYFGGILTGIAREVANARGSVVLVQTLEAGRSGDEVLAAPEFDLTFTWDNVDGMIALASSARGPYLERVRAAGTPVVLAGHQVDGFTARAAMPDNAGGVWALVEHLVTAHGHTQIAFVGSLDQTDMVERFVAYQQALRSHGIEPNPALFYPAPNNAESGGRLAAAAMVADDLPASAVVAATDRNALGVIAELRACGRPGSVDVAVVGFDDIEGWSSTNPTLTTVSQEFDQIGALAARTLLAELNGAPPSGTRLTSPSHLVIRNSCGCRTDQHAKARRDLAGGVARALAGEELDADVAPVVLAGAHQLEVAVSAAVRGDARAVDGALYTAVRSVAQTAPTAESLVRLTAAVTEHVADVISTTPGSGNRLLLSLTNRFSSALWLAHTASYLARASTLEHTIAEQYAVSTSLLNRCGGDPRTLAWMSTTPVRIGCFAAWQGVPGDSELRIEGIYDPRATLAGSDIGVGTRLPATAFPSSDMLAQADAAQGEVTFVIPVRRGGADWGVLSVIGWIDPFSRDARASYNHWAALLAVAFEQERLLEDVLTSEERYAVAARATDAGLWDWDLRHGTTYYSERCREILGCDARASGTDVLLQGVHPDDIDSARAVLSPEGAPHLDSDHPVEIELRMRTPEGPYRWVQCRAIAVRTAPEQPAHRIVGSLSDIDDRKVLEERLRWTALHDAVTGLPNRTLFTERLQTTLDTATALDGAGVTVLFMDLDGFKAVNDTFGHGAGDELLTVVGDQLRRTIRAQDTAARFGGDEFAVLLHTDDPGVVLAIVERIQAAIARPVTLGGQTVRVTASVGIAGAAPGGSASAVLRDADIAMYRAKAHRRGSWSQHDA